jgi:hypothetical protein
MGRFPPLERGGRAGAGRMGIHAARRSAAGLAKSRASLRRPAGGHGHRAAAWELAVLGLAMCAVGAVAQCNLFPEGSKNEYCKTLPDGSKSEVCETGNCTGGAAHVFAQVPQDERGPCVQCSGKTFCPWLKKYTSDTAKYCYCANTTMAGPNCDRECPNGHANPCNGHGECLYASATCACDFGWQGNNCTAKCPETFGFVCASKGTCVQDGEHGSKCECFPGFRGGNCTIECKGGAARPCSQRGICEEDGSCTCLGGWRGEDCSVECPGSNVFPCNMKGKCNRELKDKKAICECDPLYR